MLCDPKLISLAVLTLQNTCLVLSMRVSRTYEGPMYLASVAVMSDELMKLLVCLVMLFVAFRSTRSQQYQIVSGEDEGFGIAHDHGPRPSGFLMFMRAEVFKSTFEFGKMAVPAICYTVQKNLLYLAISNLDAAVFQVAYQGKILTTAFFSILILRKEMSFRQIFALFVLLVGVALVQLSSLDSPSDPQDNESSRIDNSIVGSLAILGACSTSGFAAIYFEWILKYSAPKEQRPFSLWVRNFQLASFAALSAALGVWARDGAAVAAKGLFHGFTPFVWFVVSMEAFGGIIVALVIKYADNILKNFATAVSIVTSVVFSALFLGFTIKTSFVVGASCVMAAVAIYTSNPKPSAKVDPADKGPSNEKSPGNSVELGNVVHSSIGKTQE